VAAVELHPHYELLTAALAGQQYETLLDVIAVNPLPAVQVHAPVVEFYTYPAVQLH